MVIKCSTDDRCFILTLPKKNYDISRNYEVVYERGYISYRHISQRFATNWTSVMTTSICLKRGQMKNLSYLYKHLHSMIWKEKKQKMIMTWKQVECMKWPQGRALTDVLDVNKKSQQMGQFVSKHFSWHWWSTNFIDKQQLHCMQWKESTPSPFPRRHILQKGQW